jgi:hypothetical protein
LQRHVGTNVPFLTLLVVNDGVTMGKVGGCNCCLGSRMIDWSV